MVSKVCVCFSVCGRVFVHGRVSLDRNKLLKVFQDVFLKACCLIMMMSVMLMRVLIDNKQMAGVRKVTQPCYDVLCIYRSGTCAMEIRD